MPIDLWTGLGWLYLGGSERKIWENVLDYVGRGFGSRENTLTLLTLEATTGKLFSLAALLVAISHQFHLPR